MQLKIVACQQVYSGLNPKGHRYTIFDISAAKPDGTLINEKLRSFEALAVGETMEVTVTPFESEQHGRSFTLHRKVSNNATGQVNELRTMVEALQVQVAALEARVAVLEGRLEPKAKTTGQGQW